MSKVALHPEVAGVLWVLVEVSELLGETFLLATMVNQVEEIWC